MRHLKAFIHNYTAIGVVILTLVGYPLIAPLSLLLDIPNRLVSVPFRALVLILSLVVIIVFRKRSISGLFCVSWWVFWGLYVSRILIDGFLNQEALRLDLGENLLYAIGMSLLPASALLIKIDKSIMKHTVFWIIFLGALGAVLNIWMVISQQSIATVAGFVAGRLESETFNPISLSHLGVTIFILSLWLLVCPEKLGVSKTVILGVCLFIGATAALAGASRGPLVALVIILPMIAFLGVRNLQGRNWLRLTIIVTCFLSSAVFLLTKVESILAFNRMQESAFTDDTRVSLYIDGWNLFINNPLIGAGTEPLGLYPHNLVLESFMFSGVFSGLLFLSIVVISFVSSARIFFSYQESSWISVLFIQFLVASMFSGALYDSASLWVIMALAVSHLASLRTENRVNKMVLA